MLVRSAGKSIFASLGNTLIDARTFANLLTTWMTPIFHVERAVANRGGNKLFASRKQIGKSFNRQIQTADTHVEAIMSSVEPTW
jgi:hypothetical protein